MSLDSGENCGCAVRRPSWRPGMLAAGTFLAAVHDDGCAAAPAAASRAMACPTCARLFPYERQTPDCVAAFVAHANACEAPADGDAPPPPALARFAPLFRVRLHAAIAALGPPSPAGRGWPAPDARMAGATPSTRAIVVRDGPWYALREGDADEVPTAARAGGARARLLLGSEAAARAPAWLAGARVGAIVNCAHNSEPLAPAALAAAGVARGVARVALVDAERVEGQDAGALIEAGADAVAAALAGAPAEGAVLVHCVAGMSRSAAVVIAFLVKHDGAALEAAAAAVKRARPVAMPNLDFWRALMALEVRERGAASVPEGALELHPGAYMPVSTHIFGEAGRS